MDTSVSTALTTLVSTAQPVVIDTYVQVFTAIVALALAIFGIRYGWAKIWSAIRGGH
jgi:hypothetical protein